MHACLNLLREREGLAIFVRVLTRGDVCRELFIALLSQTKRDKAPSEGANTGASGYIVVLILIVGIFVSQV